MVNILWLTISSELRSMHIDTVSGYSSNTRSIQVYIVIGLIVFVKLLRDAILRRDVSLTVALYKCLDNQVSLDHFCKQGGRFSHVSFLPQSRTNLFLSQKQRTGRIFSRRSYWSWPRWSRPCSRHGSRRMHWYSAWTTRLGPD